MEFLTTELAEKLELNEDQVKAITEGGANYMADFKNEQDKRVAGEANKHAEGILSGAADKVKEVTGIEREQGEKIADYLTRSSSSYLDVEKKELIQLKADYDTKLKAGGGSEELTKQLEEYKSKVDKYQEKIAELEPQAEYKTKYDEIVSKHEVLEKDNAFNGVKPTFSKDANEYEVTAKWNEFKKGILSTYNIEIVDGEALAVDKENKYKQTKLKDLVSESEGLQSLVNGRQQLGSGAIVKEEVTIEGVPFTVPKGADSATRSKLIREHLAKEGVSSTDTKYSSKFSALNDAILKANK